MVKRIAQLNVEPYRDRLATEDETNPQALLHQRGVEVTQPGNRLHWRRLIAHLKRIGLKRIKSGGSGATSRQ